MAVTVHVHEAASSAVRVFEPGVQFVNDDEPYPGYTVVIGHDGGDDLLGLTGTPEELVQVAQLILQAASTATMHAYAIETGRDTPAEGDGYLSQPDASTPFLIHRY